MSTKKLAIIEGKLLNILRVPERMCTSLSHMNYESHYKFKGNVNECRTAMVKNLIKESFYGKIKKKAINVLTVFFISHKSDVKTFLK